MDEEIRVDVIVIGGGLAGMMAALAAQSIGKVVAIVSQGPVGKSGNTLISGAGISAATDDPGNEPDKYFADIMKSGKGLNNVALTKKLADDSMSMIQKLEKYGVDFIRRDGALRRRQPGGHSVPRNIPTDSTGISYLNRGLTLLSPLLAKLNELNVQLISGVRVLRLLQTENRVVGAEGMDKKGRRYRFLAASVVLATGGLGYLYAKTNNVNDIVGDGLAMALEAGCVLQDMEQVQFYPTAMFNPVKSNIQSSLFGVGAVLRNINRERFMQNYHADGDMATRDFMARAIFLEIGAGRGIDGSVYMDCTNIPEGQVKEMFKEFYHFLTKARIDPTKDYLKVSPCVHYSLGGIVIDEYSRTRVPGLYAAGEICGGIHGANRLAGSALMEDCVFGWQAGVSAAVEQKKQCYAIDKDVTLPMQPRTVELAEKVRALRTLLWEQASLVRSEQSLSDAEKTIELMEEQLLRDGKSYESMGIMNMLKVAKMIVISAMIRKESRGAHYRSDYSEMDNQFNGNVHCWQENGNIKVRLMGK